MFLLRTLSRNGLLSSLNDALFRCSSCLTNAYFAISSFRLSRSLCSYLSCLFWWSWANIDFRVSFLSERANTRVFYRCSRSLPQLICIPAKLLLSLEYFIRLRSYSVWVSPTFVRWLDYLSLSISFFFMRRARYPVIFCSTLSCDCWNWRISVNALCLFASAYLR